MTLFISLVEPTNGKFSYNDKLRMQTFCE